MAFIIDDAKTDMSPAMRDEAQEVIEKALSNDANQSKEKDICAEVRKHFDEKYYPQWHCIMGKKFGSSVTHEKGTLIYGVCGDYGMMMWKAGQ